MMGAETEVDRPFEQFASKYLHTHAESAHADHRAATAAELAHERANLVKWYAAGKEVLATVEDGLEAAAKTLASHLYPDEMRADELVEFRYQRQNIIVPAWFRCYATARAMIEVYRAATEQPPLA